MRDTLLNDVVCLTIYTIHTIIITTINSGQQQYTAFCIGLSRHPVKKKERSTSIHRNSSLLPNVHTHDDFICNFVVFVVVVVVLLLFQCLLSFLFIFANFFGLFRFVGSFFFGISLLLLTLAIFILFCIPY